MTPSHSIYWDMPILIVVVSRSQTPAALAGIQVFFLLYVAASSGLATASPSLHRVMAGFGGVAEDGVHIFGGAVGSEELGAERGVRLIRAALDPDLRGLVMLPVGKQAHAVAAGENIVEMVFKMGE